MGCPMSRILKIIVSMLTVWTYHSKGWRGARPKEECIMLRKEVHTDVGEAAEHGGQLVGCREPVVTAASNKLFRFAGRAFLPRTFNAPALPVMPNRTWYLDTRCNLSSRRSVWSSNVGGPALSTTTLGPRRAPLRQVRIVTSSSPPNQSSC